MWVRWKRYEDQKGLDLTVGGSQLADIRHFVDRGRMRSWPSGEKERTDERTPTDYRPLLLHIHRGATAEKRITENKPLIRERKPSYIGWRRCRPLAASVSVSVRSDAPVRMQGVCAEELAMRLAKGCLKTRWLTQSRIPTPTCLIYFLLLWNLYFLKGQGQKVNSKSTYYLYFSFYI